MPPWNYFGYVGNRVANKNNKIEKGLAFIAKPLILSGDPTGNRTPVTGVRVRFKAYSA